MSAKVCQQCGILVSDDEPCQLCGHIQPHVEKICPQCGSRGPFQIVSDGQRCQACGHVAPQKAAEGNYVQPPDPQRPRPSGYRISPTNPCGM